MRITYTNRFYENYIRIKKYYEYTYNENVFIKLDNELNCLIETLKVFPRAYSEIYESSYRRAVLTKYVVVYTVKEDEIRIVNIYHGNENYLTKI